MPKDEVSDRVKFMTDICRQVWDKYARNTNPKLEVGEQLNELGKITVDYVIIPAGTQPVVKA